MTEQEKSYPELRQSQLLSTFGPGAMVDLPERSVVISGLSFWRGDKQLISEPRLRDKVCEKFKIQNIKFLSPPQQNNDPNAPLSAIDAFVFPKWFLGQVEYTFVRKGKEYRTRPFFTWNTVKGGAKFDGKKVSVVPVRFVQACTHGHLSDLDWRSFCHNDYQTSCKGQLWLDEAGSGNDFDDIYVRCECGKARQLAQAKRKDSTALGICQGHRPWLGDRQFPCYSTTTDDDGQIVTTDKHEYNRLLIRSASNAYFSQTLSVISLPDTDTHLNKVLDRFYERELKEEENIEDLKRTLKKSRYDELKKFPVEKVWQEIEQRKQGVKSDSKNIKPVELEALLAAPETPNQSNVEMEFDAQTQFLSSTSPWFPFLDRLVLVHRLREVIALLGFTRFEATLPNIEGELDDLGINVQRADIDFEQQWLPAIENKGEGFFINVRKDKIEAWVNQPAVKARGIELENGYHKWLDSRNIPRNKAKFPGLPYIMLHSLSHLLITAVSLECGYAASAIKERIYAHHTIGYGILLYTGTSGSEGTLGGLVEVGRNIEHHLSKALELGRLCSNDPVCSQHRPTNNEEERYLHGAACHGCLLIAETSCEHRNEFLDRALVVGTVEGLGAQFFPDDLY